MKKCKCITAESYRCLLEAAQVEVEDLARALKEKQQVRDAAMRSLTQEMHNASSAREMERIVRGKLTRLRRVHKTLRKECRDIVGCYVLDTQQRYLIYRHFTKLFKREAS